MKSKKIFYIISFLFITEIVTGLKIDCAPDYLKLSNLKQACQKRKCIYSEDIKIQGEPACYFKSDYGYSLEFKQNLANGWFLSLKRNPNQTSLFGNDAENINVWIDFRSLNSIRIKFFDKSTRYEVPNVEIDDPPQEFYGTRDYDVSFKTDGPIFSFKVFRKSDKQIFLDTDLPGLIFSDQFIQFPTKLGSKYVYGLGESEQTSLLHDLNYSKWTGWTRDSPPNGRANLYGVFPILTVLENSGKAHSILFMNSNAQEWVLNPDPSFVYKTTGGLLDIYLFIGDSPEDNFKDIANTFGKYHIPPYWSLGHHLCRYGYKNTKDMIDAVARTDKYNIPLDVQWADIDIMRSYLDFTIDSKNFSGLKTHVSNLHNNGRKFVAIVDPGIDFENDNFAYELGSLMDVWVKRGEDGSPVVGKVWPYGKVHYPDFFKESTAIWWENCIDRYIKKELPVDGLWIDMNEPSNFGDGDYERGCKRNSLNYPPYTPPGILGQKLIEKTICLDSTHEMGGVKYNHYDVHSLYGHSEAKVTISALRKVLKKRSFVLTRSSFIGSGRYTAKWLGDNFSTWAMLKESIIGIIQFNMFAIPHVGADICGFLKDTTPELCIRWYQVGAFYPFARNHNGIGQINQDPGVFGPEPAKIIRNALRYRYNFLPILYTLFYEHSVEGSTVIRSLWNVFSSDIKTRAIDDSFMWGDQILIAPITDDGARKRDIYLPESQRWYDVSKFLEEGLAIEIQSGLKKNYPVPLNLVPIFLKGGIIFPFQRDSITTSLSRNNPFDLEVALDGMHQAYGKLYIDDGNSLNPVSTGDYFLIEFRHNNITEGKYIITSKILHRKFVVTTNIKSVGVLGLPEKEVVEVKLNGQIIHDYSMHKGRLQIYDQTIPISNEFILEYKLE